MNVSGWETPARFFPWNHVCCEILAIDPVVYDIAMEAAQDLHLDRASACPICRRPPSDLFWCSVTSPEETWDAGTGEVGFLTICETCRLQVDFLVDRELTELQEEAWRSGRFFY